MPMAHRARTLVVANRTAQVNQIRGLLGEFGLVAKKKGVARPIAKVGNLHALKNSRGFARLVRDHYAATLRRRQGRPIEWMRKAPTLNRMAKKIMRRS